jgi:hypothetical protein
MSSASPSFDAVIRFLRTLWPSWKSSEPSPVSPKRYPIDLATIEGALINEKEFPRPQWKIIRGWINEHISSVDVGRAWEGVAFCWVSKLQADLGSTYSISESQNFILLTSRSQVLPNPFLEQVNQPFSC